MPIAHISSCTVLNRLKGLPDCPWAPSGLDCCAGLCNRDPSQEDLLLSLPALSGRSDPAWPPSISDMFDQLIITVSRACTVP
jgi:hypothetical protein